LNSQIIFEKYSNTKFHENPFNGNTFHADGQTDKHDETHSRFSQLSARTYNSPVYVLRDAEWGKLDLNLLSIFKDEKCMCTWTERRPIVLLFRQIVATLYTAVTENITPLIYVTFSLSLIAVF